MSPSSAVGLGLIGEISVHYTRMNLAGLYSHTASHFGLILKPYTFDVLDPEWLEVQ
jgi:hypothetical protein